MFFSHRARVWASFVALLCLSRLAGAQVPERVDAALRAIYGENLYSALTLGPTQWLNGGSQYALLNANGDIIAHDSSTGRPESLVAASELVDGNGTRLRVAQYAVSNDLSKVLVFTNTQRVWRQNTRGDYWLFDRKLRRARKVGGDAPTASLMFAKFSPDGTRIAYVQSQNLYVEDVADGHVTRLTSDGSGDLINGTSDWVNEEEFFIRDAFRWSPDSRFIAYWQFDTTGVERFTLINNTDTLYPTLKEFAYPKAGTPNSKVRLGIVPSRGGATVWVRTPGDPREHYIPRMDWLDASTIVFDYTTRRQNSNDLMLANTATGESHRVHGERSDTWIDSADPLVLDEIRPAFWLNGGREFSWISDKDGWRHVYAVRRDGNGERLITRFAADAIQISAVDDRAGRIYFMASPDNATQRYLYVADIGTGNVRRVTPGDVSGTHSYDISPDGRWALDTYSRADMPPRTVLVSLPDHAIVRVLIDNDTLAQRARTQLQPPTEFFQVSLAEGITLDGMLLKPPSFDPTRKYPVIVVVYTEPADTNVDDRWAGAAGMFRRVLAWEGYLVVAFENRGTPVPKGAAWRKSIYGSIGDLSAKEQAAALTAFAASRPWADLSRVGIYGTSGGGSATLNALFRFPDLYKVGVSMAPVPDQRLYDSIYQERYMGLPQENPDGYRRGSPINFADGLRGHLLLIHGTGDDNVHIQGTERLINRLIELGKDVDTMIYPNRTHAISEGEGTALHRWRMVARYFLAHLPSTSAD
ncbi:MAG TPA: S9 family peptidase [Vicinamibacterales bacterium]|jgi:dipeptidyl-peptidase-4|nr:S9 family peptidase [Vicinamibacterales bacterium]